MEAKSQNTSVTSRINEDVNDDAAVETLLRQKNVKALLERVGRDVASTEEMYLRAAERLQALRGIFAKKKLVINWYQFARRHVPIEKNRRGVILKIMDATDERVKRTLARRYLDKQNARAEKSRGKTRKTKLKERHREMTMSQTRKDLLAWVRKAPEPDVTKVWNRIRRAQSRNHQSKTSNSKHTGDPGKDASKEPQ